MFQVAIFFNVCFSMAFQRKKQPMIFEAQYDPIHSISFRPGLS